MSTVGKYNLNITANKQRSCLHSLAPWQINIRFLFIYLPVTSKGIRYTPNSRATTLNQTQLLFLSIYIRGEKEKHVNE